MVRARWSSARTSQVAFCRRTRQDKDLVGVASRGGGNLGIIALVDQHLRQRVGIELDDPAPSGPGRTKNVRTIGVPPAEPNARPGFGLSLRISAIMSTRFLVRRHRRLSSGPRNRAAPIDRAGRRKPASRIEAIPLLELDREALPPDRARRCRADRSSAITEHAFDLGSTGTRASRPAAARSPLRVSGFVDQIDQILSDHPLHRIGDGKRELLAQPVGERRFGGDESFGDCSRRHRVRRSRRRPIRNMRRAPPRCGTARFGVIDRGIVERVVGLRRAGGTLRFDIVAVPRLTCRCAGLIRRCSAVLRRLARPPPRRRGRSNGLRSSSAST